MRSPAKPLRGLRILVTRPRDRSEEICRKIRELGGEPVEFPTIEIDGPTDYSKVDAALSRLGMYDWLVFTSRTGVRRFFERAVQKGLPLERPGCKIAAVGPSTAAGLKDYGLEVSFLPSTYLTGRLADELPEVQGKKILLVRAEGVDEAMVSRLKERGAAQVNEVYPYRVKPLEPDAKMQDFDAVIFTSPSTVRSFKTILGKGGLTLSKNVIVCCIGVVTAKAARELGFAADVIPKEYTVEGLLQSLCERVSPRRVHQNIILTLNADVGKLREPRFSQGLHLPEGTPSPEAPYSTFMDAHVEGGGRWKKV